MAAEIIPGDRITEFFASGFEHTAWRLETRSAYAADQRSESYRRWLRGEAPRQDPASPWLALMRKLTAEGKRVERVRVVDDPPSENQRYSLASVTANLEAGEDIRYLSRERARQLALPGQDFWLFDSRRLALFRWDETGWATHLDLDDDTTEVLAACQVRDAAWHYAERYEEFTRRVPSSV